MNVAAAIEPNEWGDLQSEMILLGNVLTDNSQLAKHCGRLKADHFNFALHAKAYQAISTMHQAGIVANPITLQAHLDEAECRHMAHCAGYTNRALMDTVVRVVMEFSHRRQLAGQLRAALARLENGGLGVPAAEVVAEVRGVTEGIMLDTAFPFRTAGQVAAEILADMQVEAPVFSTGYTRLDAAMDGG
jgi:replicative DNA helicase